MRTVIFYRLHVVSTVLATLVTLRCTNDTAGSSLTVGTGTPTMDPAIPADPTNTGDPTGTGGTTTVDPTMGGDNISGVNLPTNDTPDMPEDLDPEDSCAGDSASATPAPAVLQFVVDTSGSMAEPPGPLMDFSDIFDPSKWEITRDAMLIALEQLGSTHAAGLSYFPGGNFELDETTCITDEVAVPIDVLGDVGSAQRDALASSLNETRPEWATPTHAALRQGVETVQAYQGDGDKFVVLITDGRPTLDVQCADIDEEVEVLTSSQPIIDEAATAAASGVRTFVIGSPGSEDAQEALSHIASVGGTAKAGCSDTGPEYCHFDMTTQADFAAALQQALSDIVGQVASCEFAIPTPPDGEILDLNRVNVNIVDGAGMSQPLGKAPAGSGCAEGWDYSPDMTRVMLCPSTCEAYKATPSASIAVEFGCVTVEIPE